MPTTQIPPGKISPRSYPQRPQGGDLYDARGWESAYRDMHDVPVLLVQLQDDLARSRKREAFWISVVVHLVLVILVVTEPKWELYLPKRPVVVIAPNDWMRQKELTYLEMPPDAQKAAKRPDTNKISDKDRIATSRTPQLDRKELQKILDSARPGMPGPTNPPGQQPVPPSPPAVAQNVPQPAAPAHPPAFANQNQVAKLQPPEATSKPSFGNSISPGSAIEQAARAAIANRGGGYSGDNGDYGLGQGGQTQAAGALDILSDTMGVDFSPYLARVLQNVKENWYRIIPESARAPLLKKGKVSIEFAILKDGKIAGMQLTGPSGDVALDRAAWGGITASNPFPPLPNEFGGQYLALRFHFYYNPDKNELQ